MPETASLVLNVASSSVEKGADRLDHLSKSATKATTATGGYTTAAKTATKATTGYGVALKSAIAPLVAALAPLLALKKAFSATVELQDFNAQLKTATGSVENASIAFDALEGFASQTPYALEQSLEAFIKLTNLGLTPSERALESYGNTASAMGKDLTQLIEAVADATTGEFERLKEFGIKSKTEGDNVSFTFRGLTTTIGKNAAEIEAYLMALGENEFAGAMGDRMATVGGQVSNLGDLWNQMFRTISEMGVGNVIAETLQIGIDALSEIIAQMESGQLEQSFESWTVAFDGWVDDFADGLGFIGGLLGASANEWGDSGDTAWDNFIGGLKLVPALVRGYIQQAGAEIGIISLYAEAAGRGIWDTLTAVFDALLESSNNFGKALGAALNPFDDTDFTTALKNGLDSQVALLESAATRVQLAYTEAEQGIDIARQARIEALGEIRAEFEETATKVAEATLESDRLRAAYEAEKEAKQAARASGGDDLEQFKITPTATTTGSGTGTVKKELSAEDSAIKSSYEDRLDYAADYFDKLTTLEESKNSEVAALGKAASVVQKTLAIQQATFDTYEMANSAYSALAGIPVIGPGLGVAAATAAITFGLANVASISSAGSFASGGIVGGTSTTGDNLTANVNSGEMILNNSQQSELFNIADGKSSGSGGGINITVENYGSSEISVQQLSENDVRIIARDVAQQVVQSDAPSIIASDLQSANSRTSKALSQTTTTERKR